MLNIKFWTFTEIFMQIGPWGEAKKAKKGTYHTFLALFQSDGVLEHKRSGTLHLFKDDRGP